MTGYADYQEAATRQHRYEAAHRRMSSDDLCALDNAATRYCIAKLAYLLGEDDAGDAAWEGLVEAVANDGINCDDAEAIAAQLDWLYPKPADWLDRIKADVAFAERQLAKRDAAKAVCAFIVRVMA
jgi:hypothetical protein